MKTLIAILTIVLISACKGNSTNADIIIQQDGYETTRIGYNAAVTNARHYDSLTQQSQHAYKDGGLLLGDFLVYSDSTRFFIEKAKGLKIILDSLDNIK